MLIVSSQRRSRSAQVAMILFLIVFFGPFAWLTAIIDDGPRASQSEQATNSSKLAFVARLSVFVLVIAAILFALAASADVEPTIALIAVPPVSIGLFVSFLLRWRRSTLKSSLSKPPSAISEMPAPDQSKLTQQIEVIPTRLQINDPDGGRAFYWALGIMVGIALVGTVYFALPDMKVREFVSPGQNAIGREHRWDRRMADYYLSVVRFARRTFTRGASAHFDYPDVLSDLSLDEKDEIRRYADLLSKDNCNKLAAQHLILQLNTDLRFQETRVVGKHFLTTCGKEYEIAFPTVYALFHGRQFNDALTLLTQYGEEQSYSSQFASWQGFILEKLERFEEAAEQFERSLFLFPNMRDVGQGQFYYVTQALRSAHKYCEAARPLELYVSFDPVNRSTSQIESIITDLHRIGKCPIETPPGEATVKVRPNGGVYLVDAEINGIAATLIFDTGASSVHLTKAFSAKAKLQNATNRTIFIRSATGVRRDFLGNVESVVVGGAKAHDVVVTVASDDTSLGDGVDGLLGQTFLSRFKVTFNASTRTLTIGPRR